METKSSGRTLAIIFTCNRCKEHKVLPYSECMKGETYEYLHNSTLPDGWKEHGYGSQILCDKCQRDYEQFMRYTKEGPD